MYKIALMLHLFTFLTLKSLGSKFICKDAVNKSAMRGDELFIGSQILRLWPPTPSTCFWKAFHSTIFSLY